MSKWLSRGNYTRSLSCRQTRPMLQSYLDQVLDQTAAGFVAAHLAECSRCTADAEAYEAIKDSLGRRQPPPTEAVERLRRFGEGLSTDAGEPSREQRSVKG